MDSLVHLPLAAPCPSRKLQEHTLGCISACTLAHSHDRADTVLGLEGVFITAATGTGQSQSILHLWMSFACGDKKVMLLQLLFFALLCFYGNRRTDVLG